METLKITEKNEKARKLIKDLEELDILEVIESTDLGKNSGASNISDLKNKITSPMNEKAINLQLEQIRNEWQPNI